MAHLPVLLKETIEILNPQPGEFFIDGTLDGGGHAKEIIKKISPGGKFLGIDWDRDMIDKFNPPAGGQKSQIILVNDNYKNLAMILKNKKLNKADGLLLDLGFSSEQLEQSGRGFSFRKDEPLLMTYSDKEKPTHRWLKELKETALTKIIREFGEERQAQKIARAIKKNLPILTSKKLAAVVAAVPNNYERGRIHPATRTFQALRLFVNQELENLKKVLDDIFQILNPGGRLAVITFHSLEDRIVKNRFRELTRIEKVALLTKKPIRPTPAEIYKNPRSRSAKLRALQII